MVCPLMIEDREEVKKCFPTLHVSFTRKCVWGTLIFGASYDSESKRFVPESEPGQVGYIEDDYEILIKFDEADSFGFPAVYEEAGCILELAKARNENCLDWHIDNRSKLCLGIFPEYKWHGVKAYILEKVIPFLYWISYRKKYEVAPWRAYSHGSVGLKEALRFPPEQIGGDIRNKRCPCGSGKKYKHCCLQRDAIILNVLRSGN